MDCVPSDDMEKNASFVFSRDDKAGHGGMHPATQEAELGGSLKPRSLKRARQHSGIPSQKDDRIIKSS